MTLRSWAEAPIAANQLWSAREQGTDIRCRRAGRPAAFDPKTTFTFSAGKENASDLSAADRRCKTQAAAPTLQNFFRIVYEYSV